MYRLITILLNYLKSPFTMKTIGILFVISLSVSCSRSFYRAVTSETTKFTKVDTIYDTTRVVMRVNDTIKTPNLLMITKKDSNVITITKIEKIPVQTHYKQVVIRDTVTYYNHKQAVTKPKPKGVISGFLDTLESMAFVMFFIIIGIVVVKTFLIK